MVCVLLTYFLINESLYFQVPIRVKSECCNFTITKVTIGIYCILCISKLVTMKVMMISQLAQGTAY